MMDVKISHREFVFLVLVSAGFFNLFFYKPMRRLIKKNYQGKLTDTGGVAVSDGAYDVVFKLYTAGAGGSVIWTESWTDASLFTDSGDCLCCGWLCQRD